MAVPSVKKNKQVIDHTNLYKWHKHWGRLQEKFFDQPYKLQEQVKIEDFVSKNNFKNVYVVKDNYIDFNFVTTNDINNADLILVTDQKFSRYTCEDIINKLNAFLDICPNLFVCLNRHYLNITGTETDKNLPDDYQEAIECWLKKELPYTIENYSEKFTDDGKYYTWVIPDQKFYIKKK